MENFSYKHACRAVLYIIACHNLTITGFIKSRSET